MRRIITGGDGYLLLDVSEHVEHLVGVTHDPDHVQTSEDQSDQHSSRAADNADQQPRLPTIAECQHNPSDNAENHDD